MGGLRRYLPVTYWTMLIGAISSAGIPGFAGFFSKDSIIEAVHLSRLPGGGFGLLNVRQKIQHLGGAFSIANKEAGGAVATITVPLEP